MFERDRIIELYGFGTGTIFFIVIGVLIHLTGAVNIILYNFYSAAITRTESFTDFLFYPTWPGASLYTLLTTILVLYIMSKLLFKTFNITMISQADKTRQMPYPYRPFFLGNIPTLIGVMMMVTLSSVTRFIALGMSKIGLSGIGWILFNNHSSLTYSNTLLLQSNWGGIYPWLFRCLTINNLPGWFSSSIALKVKAIIYLGFTHII